MPGAGGADVDPEREIRRVHTILEDWFGGIRSDPTPLGDALAPSFNYVGPSGAVLDREEALDRWSDQAAAYADSTPPFAVDVRAVERGFSVYDLHLATYERHQRVDGDWVARACSVVLHETADTPTGLEWLHLHESPIDAGPGDGGQDQDGAEGTLSGAEGADGPGDGSTDSAGDGAPGPVDGS